MGKSAVADWWIVYSDVMMMMREDLHEHLATSMQPHGKCDRLTRGATRWVGYTVAGAGEPSSRFVGTEDF